MVASAASDRVTSESNLAFLRLYLPLPISHRSYHDKRNENQQLKGEKVLPATATNACHLRAQIYFIPIIHLNAN